MVKFVGEPLALYLDKDHVKVIGIAGIYLDIKTLWGKFMITCPTCNYQSWKDSITSIKCEKCNSVLFVDYCHKDDGGLFRMVFQVKINELSRG